LRRVDITSDDVEDKVNEVTEESSEPNPWSPLTLMLERQIRGSPDKSQPEDPLTSWTLQ